MSGTTQGVPRIREILGVSKFIKTPRMIIQLEPLISVFNVKRCKWEKV